MQSNHNGYSYTTQCIACKYIDSVLGVTKGFEIQLEMQTDFPETKFPISWLKIHHLKHVKCTKLRLKFFSKKSGSIIELILPET